ncbi:hypothetical protein OG194_27345 [Streptomyces sp. NBC_01288]|uniref:hypothetical protein n=1 Tax=Streptomyces sp. NBC_01288 TaxID=2903814 RepID=UPI002E152567|nr:hypothetical protein OG194_27345 [Streptomyces sp. NBC_01288]
MAGPSDRHPGVRVHEIDPVNRTYTLTGGHHDKLDLRMPYDIDVGIGSDALKAL